MSQRIYDEIAKGLQERPQGFEEYILVQEHQARRTELSIWLEDQMQRVSHIFEELSQFKTSEEVDEMKAESRNKFIQFYNLANGASL